MAVKASDIPFGSAAAPPSDVAERLFRDRGDQRYSLTLRPANIEFFVDRLRRERNELTGELTVTLPESTPGARTINGIVSSGDMNFSSVQARGTRAKLLADRANLSGLDWHGYLEEFCLRVIAAERHGKPAIILSDLVTDSEDDEDAGFWDIEGFRMPKELPMIVFGSGGSGKSMFVLYLAGRLAQMGVNVLYADWEFSDREHFKRLKRLFQPMPKIFYARCDSPLPHQVDRLSKMIREHKIGYMICDSVGFAADGPAESQETAAKHYKALRQLNVGSMNVAHMPKARDDGSESSVFGSAFWVNGARSVWFCDKSSQNPPGELRFGLHHRKTNLGKLQSSLGYKFVFDRAVTRLETIDVKSVDELAAQLPPLDRMKRLLAGGEPLTPKTIGEELNLPPTTVRSVLSRHKSQFIKLGLKYGLKAADDGDGELF
jgi:hypothetical protein